MNRRRRFGSTILLSSLAALAVVGTGLAVGGTLLAEGSQDFNVTFTDNTKPEMGTVVVSEELKSTTLDVVFDDEGGTVAFSNDIVFEYTPAEGTNLEGKVLSLDYTATFTPDAFLTYFDVANDEGTLAVDPVATTADGVYTFTLKKDALGITLKAEQTYKAAKEALEGQAKVNLAFQVTADDEEVPPEPVEPVVTEVKLDSDALTLTAGGEAKTLTATVTVDQGEAPIVNWTIPENDSITVTGEDTNTLTITPVKAGTVDITATAGEKSAKATITVEEAVDPTPEYTSISEIKELPNDATFTGRGYFMGTNGVVYEDYNSYNGVFVADGSEYYLLYQVEADLVSSEWVVGETIIEFDGTVSNYQNTKEAKVTAIRVVEDATGLETPVIPTLNAENVFELSLDMISTKVHIVDATVTELSVGDFDNTTITFTVGANEYSLYMDSRYNDMTQIEGMKVGDTFSGYAYVGENTNTSTAQFIYLNDCEYESTIIPLETLTISGSKTVEVGSTITLTANPNAGAELGEVTWTSSNKEVATVENGVVTGLTEGTTQITAKSGEVTSEPFQVTVVAATTTEGLVADYSSNIPASISNNIYSSPLDTSSVIEVLNSGGVDIAESASTAEKLYKDSKYTGIKFSTGSAQGKMTFTTTQSFRKVVINAIAWSKDSASISVNGTSYDFVNKDGVTSEEFTFTFETESSEMNIVGTKRFVITGITLY